jgi:hypothetical protein
MIYIKNEMPVVNGTTVDYTSSFPQTDHCGESSAVKLRSFTREVNFSLIMT